MFATQEYLKKNGTPLTPQDLDDHEIIVYGEDVPAPVADMNWLLQAGATPGKPREPALRVRNNFV